MLTADLVRARKRGDKLCLTKWASGARDRALAIGAQYIDIAVQSVGNTRGEVERAFGGVSYSAREKRVALGLRKLVLDRCDFDSGLESRARELRASVFSKASRARAELDAGQPFDRDEMIAQCADEMGISASDLEEGLYSDLKTAHRLRDFQALSAEALIDEYDSAQAQAVLLRAERVTVDVQCDSAAALRDLFRKMKFLRLLYSVHEVDTGYRIEIDGPYSLFASVTKYGLQLALLLPSLRACTRFSLRAVVRWGKTRERLTFELSGSHHERENTEASLPEEVETLRAKFEQSSLGGWSAQSCGDILHLPGIGLCVPDLVFTRDEDRVYLEVLGFWSRDAVWKRVELVTEGLKQPIVFAVPKRLRVSESVLEDDLPGALYVYRSTLNPAQVRARLEAVSAAAREPG